MAPSLCFCCIVRGLSRPCNTLSPSLNISFHLEDIVVLLSKQTTLVSPHLTSAYCSSTVICRERKTRYRRLQALRLQTEVEELALRQVRAWDGVRIATIFAAGYSPGGAQGRPRLPRVRDPLTARERTRLYDLLH